MLHSAKLAVIAAAFVLTAGIKMSQLDSKTIKEHPMTVILPSIYVAAVVAVAIFATAPRAPSPAPQVAPPKFRPVLQPAVPFPVPGAGVNAAPFGLPPAPAAPAVPPPPFAG